MRIPQDLQDYQNQGRGQQAYIEKAMMEYEEDDVLNQNQPNTAQTSIPTMRKTAIRQAKNINFNKVVNSNQYNKKIVVAVVVAILLTILFIYLKYQQSKQTPSPKFKQDRIQNVQDRKNDKIQQKSKQGQKKLQDKSQQQVHLTKINTQMTNKTSRLQEIKYQNKQQSKQQTHLVEVIKTDTQSNLEKLKQKKGQTQTEKRYVYGDSIDFTKIPKRSRGTPGSLLTTDNLNKAAQFYNLLGKDIEKDQILKQIADMEIEYYDKKYQIIQFQEQIQICVFILSYNNEPQDRYKANLDSVFQQNYQNYFIVYVNDQSSDRTGQLVQKYMDQNPHTKQKMTLINNQIRKTKSRNQYELAHQYCKPGAIMFPFDGDDCILGKQIFKLLNAIYQKRSAKFVYFNFLQFHKAKPSEFLLLSGYSKQVPQNIAKNRNYRTYGVPIGLRTWVSDIFLNISEADYKMNGQFVNVGEDLMVMYSLEELAGDKVVYVPQIVYAYNQDTGINDSSDDKKLKQRDEVRSYVKHKKKLQQYKQKVVFRLKKPKNQFTLPKK